MITKVQENKLRRAARRQGLELRRSPRRDTRSVDYSLYAIVDIATGDVLNPPGPVSNYSMTAADVARHLGEEA